MQIQTTATIRDRGQFTIPDVMRKILDWAKPKSVVSVAVTENKELLIKPFESQKKEVNWDKVWMAIRRARSFKGKRGNLSKFIIEDRERH